MWKPSDPVNSTFVAAAWHFWRILCLVPAPRRQLENTPSSSAFESLCWHESDSSSWNGHGLHLLFSNLDEISWLRSLPTLPCSANLVIFVIAIASVRIVNGLRSPHPKVSSTISTGKSSLSVRVTVTVLGEVLSSTMFVNPCCACTSQVWSTAGPWNISYGIVCVDTRIVMSKKSG